MTFEIFKAFPPDHETPVAELNVRHDGVVEIPAEICRENEVLKIKIFGREGGVAWEYSLADWVDAVRRAVECLDQAQDDTHVKLP